MNKLFFLFILSSLLSAAVDEKQISEFRETLGQMVKADTSNPPGNESRIVEIVKKKLDDAGVKYEVVDFAPGRQNIIARLKGEGKEKPLLLLAHIDVVGTANQTWTTDPHALTERDKYLYGRGVHDDLGMAAMNLQIFLDLKRKNVALKRDVVLALTGDEESNGTGIQEVLKRQPQLLDVGICLNEGGGPELSDDGKMKLIDFQVAEKTYQDFEWSTKGTTGHSSVPLDDNAIYRLAGALDRWAKHVEPARLIDVTRAYFLQRAPIESPKLGAAMKKLALSKGTLPAAALKEVEKDPVLRAELRTTCVATMVSSGTRVNALPASATANINCRILPDETSDQVKARMEKVIADPLVQIKMVGGSGVGGQSPLQGEVNDAVHKVVTAMWPGVPIIPSMSLGATDSKFLRMRGVAAYGMNPIAVNKTDGRRMHGIDERFPVSSIEPGLDYYTRLVLELAAK